MSARRCHLSSCLHLPCSSRLYSSFSFGTTGNEHRCQRARQGKEGERERKEGRGDLHIKSILFCSPADRLWTAIPEIVLGSRCRKSFQLYGSSA